MRIQQAVAGLKTEGLMWQGMPGLFRSWKRLPSDSQEGNETCPYHHKDWIWPTPWMIVEADSSPEKNTALLMLWFWPQETKAESPAEPCYTTTPEPQKCERINACLTPLGLWWFFTAAMENSHMYSVLKSGMYFNTYSASQFGWPHFKYSMANVVNGYHIGQYRSRPREIKISRKC